MNNNIQEIKINVPFQTKFGIILLIILAIIAFISLLIYSLSWVMGLSGHPIFFIAMVFFGFIAVVIIIIVIKILWEVPDQLQPVIFSEKGFTIDDKQYPWGYVDTLFINKDLDYFVLLYKGYLGSLDSVGLKINKKYVMPDSDSLIKLVKRNGIRIREDKSLTMDIFKMISFITFTNGRRKDIEELMVESNKPFIEIKEGTFVKVFVGGLMASLLIGSLILLLLEIYVFFEMIFGLRPFNQIIIGFMAFLAMLSFVFMSSTRSLLKSFSKPDYATEHWITYMNKPYLWEHVAVIVLNRGEKYFSILFKSLQGPDHLCGIYYFKKNVKPSFQTFIEFARKIGVQIVHDKTLTLVGLNEIKNKRLRKSSS